MLCLDFCSNRRYVRTSQVPLHISGWAQIHQIEESTGQNGKRWVCREKKAGLVSVWSGIGFSMIHEFNMALLAKQLWRLVQYPDSLVARVLRGRYYLMSSPLRMSSTSSPSYVWNSISAARKLLLLGIRQKIHYGYEVKFWEDSWIPTSPARLSWSTAPVLHLNMRVSDLINDETKECNVGLL